MDPPEAKIEATEASAIQGTEENSSNNIDEVCDQSKNVDEVDVDEKGDEDATQLVAKEDNAIEKEKEASEADENELLKEKEEGDGEHPSQAEEHDDEEMENESEEVDKIEEGKEENNNEGDATEIVSTKRKDAGDEVRRESKRKRVSEAAEDVGHETKMSKQDEEEDDDAHGNESHDKYCWVCHKEGVSIFCKSCPRSYHTKCISLPDSTDPPESNGTTSSCVCPECVVVMNAENIEFRSEAMKLLTIDQLMSMLKFICNRMKSTSGAEPFMHPVQPEEAYDYYDYIIYPMDISTLEKNVKQRQYGSTEAFLADAQWIVHNSIVFNSVSSPYTLAAKRILKVCRQELAEVETCPECYTNAHTKPDSWFIEACQKRPHILVWAKLKGFPFWPAKAMKMKDEIIDVRFFGQHDRAWVLVKDCFYYSEEMPCAPPKKNGALQASLEELRQHVEKLKAIHGNVVFQPAKTPIGNKLGVEQIKVMFPEYIEPEPVDRSIEESGSNSPETASSKATITTASTKDPLVDAETIKSGEDSKAKTTSLEKSSESEKPSGILASALAVKRDGGDGNKSLTSDELEPQEEFTEGFPSVQDESYADEMDLDIEEEDSTPATLGMTKSENESIQRLMNNQAISKTLVGGKIRPKTGAAEVGQLNMLNKPKVPQQGVHRMNNNMANRFIVKDGVVRPVGNKVPRPQLRVAGQNRTTAQTLKANSAVLAAPQLPAGITLPGGTITVTPLSLGGTVATTTAKLRTTNADLNGSRGSQSPTATSSSKADRLSVVQRKSLMANIPPSVNSHLQNLTKNMTDVVRATVEQIIIDIVESGLATQSSKSDVQKMQTEVDKVQARFAKELTDLKHNSDIALRDLRLTLENDKKRALAELKRQMNEEKIKAVNEAKKKQWCANCSREALFYCCWNTSYCGYPCQEGHWPSHMASCTQNNGSSK